MPPKLLLVVPCYNEQEILEITNKKLNDYFDQLVGQNIIAKESEICYVNDGSKDNTWDIIEKITSQNPRNVGIKLSKNYGHQNALVAGLLEFKNQFDCYISIDADLQDDIYAMSQMIEKYNEGAAIVYGVRDDRSNDSFFKRFSAERFYKLMQKLGVPLVFNHADFRLIDNRILIEFERFDEVNLFIRGVIPIIGFKSDKVFYKRLGREAGETKYPVGKMLSFAWNSVTSFSTIPMKLVLWFGIFNFFVFLAIGIYVLISNFITGNTNRGWSSTLLVTAYFGSSILIAIGLIGEYIGKIYEEVKGRPRYIIEKIIKK